MIFQTRESQKSNPDRLGEYHVRSKGKIEIKTNIRLFLCTLLTDSKSKTLIRIQPKKDLLHLIAMENDGEVKKAGKREGGLLL